MSKLKQKIKERLGMSTEDKDARDMETEKCIQADMDEVEENEKYREDWLDSKTRPSWINRPHKDWTKNITTPALNTRFTKFFSTYCGIPLGIISFICAYELNKLHKQHGPVVRIVSGYFVFMGFGTCFTVDHGIYECNCTRVTKISQKLNSSKYTAKIILLHENMINLL